MQYPSQELPPLSQLEKLAEVSERDGTQAAEAWEKRPPDPQFKWLLRANPLVDAVPEFYFDKNLQRYKYKDSGQFVSEVAVRSLTEKLIGLLEGDLATVGNLLANNKISVATWEQTTAETLKRLHIQQYMLGKGGLKNMAQRDYGIIGKKLGGEYEYLRGFSKDLISKGMTEAQFKYRLELYAQTAWGSYERGRLEGHREAGYAWERRIQNSRESCADCIGYAALLWQPIGTLPTPTQQSACKANCRCFKIFARQKPGDSLLSRNGWLKMGLKQKLRQGLRQIA